MAKFLSDYVCDRSLPSYQILFDDWFRPNIWAENQDIDGRYDGWLNKPQYRIVKIGSSVMASYFVFCETVDRDFVGNYSTLEEAHQAGQKSVGCVWI